MSVTRTSGFRRVAADHFEPQEATDPAAQRRLRGQLEQVDYTAFVSNREVIGQMLGKADAAKVQRLAIAASTARARWVAEALAITEEGPVVTVAQVDKLAHLRAAYEELLEVYEAMRRMIERGYLAYEAPSLAQHTAD
jgi:long-subunit acyl-CoA synthetase (AMP-forming)